MKKPSIRFIKSQEIQLTAKVVGLLSFIILCLVCVASPFAVLAKTTPNTVHFVRDYGNINQFVVMPNGQIMMQPKSKTNSILYGIKRSFTSSNTLDSCATLNAVVGDGSPTSDGSATIDGSPTNDGSDTLDSGTCSDLLTAAADGNNSPNIPEHTPNNLSHASTLDMHSSPSSVNVGSSLESLSPNASATSSVGTTSPASSAPLPSGEIITVQLGKDIVVAIVLGHNRVLMPDGTTMNLLMHN